MNDYQIPNRPGWYWALLMIDNAQALNQWVLVSIGMGGVIHHDGSSEPRACIFFGGEWLESSQLLAIGEYVAPLRYREDT